MTDETSGICNLSSIKPYSLDGDKKGVLPFSVDYERDHEILQKGECVRIRELRKNLDTVYGKYHRPAFLCTDPLEYVRRLQGKKNREIGGLVFSSLSYGRVEQIRSTIEKILERTGTDLDGFVKDSTLAEKKRIFSDIKHRFNAGGDIALLMECTGRAIERSGSLEGFFCKGLRVSHKTVREALDSFVNNLREIAADAAARRSRYFEFLLPAPASGSACKRLVMFLRWMVRPDDGIDLGEWKRVPASKLVMPVDTHVAAVSRLLGLTTRKSADWTMVEEVTAAMRRVCAVDPARYDFSLCRAGMIDFRSIAGAA
jgi:uncharacterized protein (TIGR02757 family)